MKSERNQVLSPAGQERSGSPGWAIPTLLACLLATGCSKPPAVAPDTPQARPRERILLKEGWRFAATDPGAEAEGPTFDDSGWMTVQVPHTWGRARQRAGWYRLHFPIAAADLADGRRVYLSFEGVSVYADVFVNGGHLGQHRGAFTRFTVDATPHLVVGDNVLAVKANNDPATTTDSLPSPLSKQLYYLYGGIYRKAWLLKTPGVHVDPLDLGASGVYLTPTEVSADSAKLEVRTLLRNGGSKEAQVEVRNRLLDAEGREVARFSGETRVAGGGTGEVRVSQLVAKPRLWAPGSPYLYTVSSTVLVEGRETDEVRERTGFRSFVYDGKDFRLNGRPILLRGVGKHQESAERLSALTDEDLRADFALLEDLGVNFVRLAHYPHAPLAYDLADEKGILVWAENGHSNPRKIVGETGVRITREMIRQNYNHPGIVMWSVGNENGFIQVPRYAAAARQEDPNRPITYATNIGRPSDPLRGLDFVARNLYQGWYDGRPWDFEDPALAWRFIAETGGGEVITHHTDYAELRHEVDVFEPEEYRQALEEVHDQVVFKDHPSDIPMFATWILREFAISKFKGRNTKGLVSATGFKKDAWYLYRTFLRPDLPQIHIASKTYFVRSGRPDNGIKAYSNAARLTLTVNGVSVGSKRNGEYRHLNERVINNVFYWPVTLQEGRNEVVVSDGSVADQTILYSGQTPPVDSPADSLVRRLKSSNAESPAWFIDAPVQDRWPFYHPVDGSADNTFGVLPDEVRGASWISTARLSDRSTQTSLSFEVTAAATVYAMGSEAPALDRVLRGAGFTPTGTRGFWWNHDLQRVAYRLWARPTRAGEVIRVPAVTADYVLMFKKS